MKENPPLTIPHVFIHSPPQKKENYLICTSTITMGVGTVRSETDFFLGSVDCRYMGNQRRGSLFPLQSNPPQRGVIYRGKPAYISQYSVDKEHSIDGFVCSNGGFQVLSVVKNNQTSTKLVRQKSNFNSKRFTPFRNSRSTRIHLKEDTCQ